jgi:DNA-3-methyladenine glycosylase II
MWSEEPDGAPDWRPAVRHLRKADPMLAQVIARVGPCRLAPRPDPFLTLVASIFSQQLSTKGATTLLNRFRDHFPRRQLTPRRVRAVLDGGPRAWEDARIRACGISRQKRAYLIDLCDHFTARRILPERLAELDDEAVIEKLAAIRGVGVWTAQMYLMFILCRPDVLPAADLGIQEAARRLHGLAERPSPKRLHQLAEPWRPWRTVACWYLWRGLEG